MIRYRAIIGIGRDRDDRAVVDENWVREINHAGYVDEDSWRIHIRDFDEQPYCHYAPGDPDGAKWYCVEVEYDLETGKCY